MFLISGPICYNLGRTEFFEISIMEKPTYKEEEWIKTLSQENDMKVFDILFVEYFPKIKRFLGGFLDSEEEAEDLSQDVFVKLWQNRQALSCIENLNAYLYRMAKNTLYSYFERTLRIETTSVNTCRNLSSTEELEDILFVKELEDLINLAIERMPAQRKAIFILSRKEGLSNQDIATRLGISKRTVETHISTALSDLRKILPLFLLFF